MAKAVEAIMPAMWAPEERKAALSRRLKPKYPTRARPATARAGKTTPHGRSEKLESISGLREKVAAVVIADETTSATQAIRAARRARALSSPSVFTATQPAPWTTRATSASK